MPGLWPAGWQPGANGPTRPVAAGGAQPVAAGGAQPAPPAALILTAALPPALQGQACAARRLLAPEAARRSPAHVTLFRHLPGLQQGSLLNDMRTLANAAAPELRLDPPVRWEKLWVARVRSPALDDLRAELAHRWHGLLAPGDLAPPRLHLSLGPGTQPPLPLPPGPWRVPGLLLWQHSRPSSAPAGERDGAFWTPLVACAFRR